MIGLLAAVAWWDLDALVEAIRASVDYPWTQGLLTAIATLFFRLMRRRMSMRERAVMAESISPSMVRHPGCIWDPQKPSPM